MTLRQEVVMHQFELIVIILKVANKKKLYSPVVIN